MAKIEKKGKGLNGRMDGRGPFLNTIHFRSAG
jgi:hypothetical protein